MPDSLGDQLDAQGWQAGAVVPSAMLPALEPHLTRPGKPALNVAASDWLVVVSQTCDVVHPDLDKEPLVEVLHCRPTEELRPQYQGRKSTRQLDFRPNRDTHADLVLSAHAAADRYVIPRDLFVAHPPDPDRSLRNTSIVNVQEWYALRYSRPVWPDAFVDRINSNNKCRKKLAKSLTMVPTDDVEVRVAILEKDYELPEDVDYNVTVFFVVDQEEWDGSYELREAAYAAHAAFVSALAACKNIKVNEADSGVKSGDEFSWQLTRTTDEWNFANLSSLD